MKGVDPDADMWCSFREGADFCASYSLLGSSPTADSPLETEDVELIIEALSSHGTRSTFHHNPEPK